MDTIPDHPIEDIVLCESIINYGTRSNEWMSALEKIHRIRKEWAMLSAAQKECAKEVMARLGYPRVLILDEPGLAIMLALLTEQPLDDEIGHGT